MEYSVPSFIAAIDEIHRVALQMFQGWNAYYTTLLYQRL